MGRISGPYGVKGWARVNAYTAQPNNLASYPTWYLSVKKVHREVAVEQTRVNGDVLFAKLTGLENREEIAKFRGADILVDLGSMPVLASNEYYWHELEGCVVEDKEGKCLGTLSHLFEAGAQPTMVVTCPGEESLIPWVSHIVLGVDLPNRTISVDWDPEYLK